MSILKLIEKIDKIKRIDQKGIERIADLIEGFEIDVLPLVLQESQKIWPPRRSFNFEDQFFSKEKMLYCQLEAIAECANNAFDAPLCIRPNFGTVFVPAIIGLEYKVFEDTYPWLVTHMTKEDINRMRFPDLNNTEMMKRTIEYIEYFKNILPDWIHIYQPDTQGPFDIAHLVYGNNIFYDLYDDPEFVHKLMEFCTELFIQVTWLLKNVIGEGENSCYHGHALPRGIFMRNGGVRISEDTATLLSPAQIDEFVIPYDKKALEAFGGGFVHYCGKSEYLLEAFLKLEEVRAINLGNPEMYSFNSVMNRFLEFRKIYFGAWPREDNESHEQYINRMKRASDGGKRSLLLHFREDQFPGYTCEESFELWKKIMTNKCI